jgi:hypothetical protein
MRHLQSRLLSLDFLTLTVAEVGPLTQGDNRKKKSKCDASAFLLAEGKGFEPLWA